MAAEWPDWAKIEDCVKRGEFMGGNTLFMTFKKQVLKSSPDEVAQQERYAPVTWEFLIGFAACKRQYRSLIVQVFNKLTQVDGWVAAWKGKPELHERVRELHEDLQAALGAQHEAIAQSIAPGALKSIKTLSSHETPEEVRQAMEKERMVDEIREETHDALAEDAGAAPEAAAVDPSFLALQEGVDAVVAIDEATLESGGLDALNKLRIGCIQCAGQEELLSKELDHAHEVFAFLLSYVKRKPDAVSRVAEVINQLMASPSWAATWRASLPLKETLRDLPVGLQAALGLQSEEVMSLVSPEARKMAVAGEVHESVKGVAERMMSIRPTRSMVRPAAAVGKAGGTGGYAGEEVKAARPAAAEARTVQDAKPDVWKEARTPEGHAYYYNLRSRESTWERPAALGGPRVYGAGDTIEVWSNSLKKWCQGTVEKLEGDRVCVVFKAPDGGMAKKELPPQLQRNLRPAKAAAKAASESWPPEEKAAYRRLFDAIPGPKDSKPGAAVAQFLGTSGLRRAALKQVWAVSNPGSKRELAFEEFAVSCRLVGHCQAMAGSKIVEEAERPLRVKLREECQRARPPALPKFGS